MANITMITLKNNPSTVATCPSAPILIKIPKIKRGSRGMIAFSIIRVMISLNSCNSSFVLSPSIAATPNPITNARTNAVVTPISGGISTLKKDVTVSSKVKLLPLVSSSAESSNGRDHLVVK